MIIHNSPAQSWPLHQEAAIRKSEGRTVRITVLVLTVVVGISFYALSQQNDERPADHPRTERVTGPAAYVR